MPSALQCYTWPDGSVTQTFDPQSPPCIASWDDSNGNGGATSQGVTATTIRIADISWEPRHERFYEPLVAFVNSSYQLYGRKLVLEFTAERVGRDDSAGQRAAAAAAAEAQAFASLPRIDLDSGGNSRVYREQLAEHGILSVLATTESDQPGERYAERSPYWWSYAPPTDDVYANVAEVVCRSLVGRAARYGGPDVANKPRKFAVVVNESPDQAPPDTSHLTQPMARCGADPTVVAVPPSRDPGERDPATLQALQALNDDAVTSIVNLTGYAPDVFAAASEVGYQPEWLITGSNTDQHEFFWSAMAPKEQTAHLFGIVPWNRMHAPTKEVEWRAHREGGGKLNAGDGINSYILRDAYHSLALLAAGIQMAGPRLTPDTFKAALHETLFPNPGAGGPPTYQAHVGFNTPDSVCRTTTRSCGGATRTSPNTRG